MAIITLTTDWGLKDHYAGTVKGSIYSLCPDATVVDITHLVPSFDIIHAAFILKNTCFDFPKGTIHIISVNTLVAQNTSWLIVLIDGHYFIGADNGIFSLITRQFPKKIIALHKPADGREPFTFPEKNIFVKAACHLASGKNPEELGTEKKEYNERILLAPATDNSLIRGNVIYIDTYGNVITNISKKLFSGIGQGRSFTLFLRRADYHITKLNTTYNEVEQGEKTAFFNSLDLLEIAINQGKADGLLGLKQNDPIRIEFYDNTNSKNDL